MTAAGPSPREDWAGLALADGSRWAVAGMDGYAARVVGRFREVTRAAIHRSGACRLLLVTSQGKKEPEVFTDFRSTAVETVYCHLEPDDDDGALDWHMRQILHAIVRAAQGRGGFLIHGALAEREGEGVILAGRSSVGKTTASRRLIPPWRPLCDDTTLVLEDARGYYWAHPWPTWGDVVNGNSGVSWDVQRAVFLRSIFILEQALGSRVTPVGPGEAACLICEASEAVSWPITGSMERDEKRYFRLQRFENICSMVRAVPCRLLHLDSTGPFWREMERFLQEGERCFPRLSRSR